VGHVEVERFGEDELFGRPNAVPLEMAPGDVLFHSSTAPHGSRANDSNTLRRVFYVHFMVREVLEMLHPEWVGAKRGFARRDIDEVQGWIEERTRGGLSGLGTANVELTPEGFVVAGEPVTPPRHWESLIARLTPQQIRTAKTLVS
jgi:hypothetical protein